MTSSVSTSKPEQAFPQIEPVASLVFDDEPLDVALYGHGTNRGTTTSIYAASHNAFKQIAGDPHETDRAKIAALCDLVTQHAEISVDDYLQISPLLRTGLQKEHSASGKGDPRQDEVLKALCELARRHRDHKGLLSVGNDLYLKWQNDGRYEEARGLLQEMIAVASQLGDRKLTAILINNNAFQYWLARDFEPAAAGFLESAHEFEALPNPVEHANALANYWAAVFELSRLERVTEMEPSLRRTARILNESHDWRERKSLIYLGRIHEARGEIMAALPLVLRAIEIDASANTPYLTVDREYLKRLLQASG